MTDGIKMTAAEAKTEWSEAWKAVERARKVWEAAWSEAHRATHAARDQGKKTLDTRGREALLRALAGAEGTWNTAEMVRKEEAKWEQEEDARVASTAAWQVKRTTLWQAEDETRKAWRQTHDAWKHARETATALGVWTEKRTKTGDDG